MVERFSDDNCGVLLRQPTSNKRLSSDSCVFGECVRTTAFREFGKQPSLCLRYTACVEVVQSKSRNLGLWNRKCLVQVIALYAFECLLGKDVMSTSWPPIRPNNTIVMHQRSERADAVDVLGGFQVVEELAGLDGRCGETCLRP